MKILLIDDEPEYLDKMVKSLELCGFQCSTVADSLKAGDLLERDSFDVVITDISMPGKSGFELIRTMRSNGSDSLVIAISGTPDCCIESNAVSNGADVYLPKPLDLETLIEIIDRGKPGPGK